MKAAQISSRAQAGLIKRREMELGSHRPLDNLLLQVSTVASVSDTVFGTGLICSAQLMKQQVMISEVHKLLGTGGVHTLSLIHI